MILVTGATGFAGSHLLQRLPSTERIAAWGRPERRPAGETSGHVSWDAVDLLDRAALARALAAAEPDLVYHLAGAPHVGSSFDNPGRPLAINAVGTHHLLTAIGTEAPRARVLV